MDLLLPSFGQHNMMIPLPWWLLKSVLIISWAHCFALKSITKYNRYPFIAWNVRFCGANEKGCCISWRIYEIQDDEDQFQQHFHKIKVPNGKIFLKSQFQPLLLNLIRKHFFRVLSTAPCPFQELNISSSPESSFVCFSAQLFGFWSCLVEHYI